MTPRQSRKPQILLCRMVDTATRIQPTEYGNVSDYVKQRAPNRASATHSRNPSEARMSRIRTQTRRTPMPRTPDQPAPAPQPNPPAPNPTPAPAPQPTTPQ